MVPGAISRSVINQQVGVINGRGRHTDSLAAADPKNRWHLALAVAGRKAEKRRRAGVAREVAVDGHLFALPQIRLSPCRGVLGPGIDFLPGAVVDSGIQAK